MENQESKKALEASMLLKGTLVVLGLVGMVLKKLIKK